MAKRKLGFRRPTADEQTVLRELQVKLLLAPKDRQKCDQILIRNTTCTAPNWWASSYATP